MIDYGVYRLTRGERMGAIAAGVLAGAAAVWIVSGNAAAALLGVPLGLYAPRWYAERRRHSRLARLRLHVKDMLQALSALLAAGRSVENAFETLEQDLLLLIGDPRAELLAELRAIARALKMGEPLSAMLLDFAARSGLEELRSFAEVFAVGKRAGGNLVDIVRGTALLIGERMEVELEMSVLLAQKRFESRAMMAMPFAFIGFLGWAAPDYMRPLHQGAGWVLLAVGLLLLAGCCWWMLRIMRIEI